MTPGTSTRLGARGAVGQLSTTTPASGGAISTWTLLGSPGVASATR